MSIVHESGQLLSDEYVMAIKGSIILLSAVIAMALARIVLRKFLLVISCLGISVSLVILGSYYYLKQFQDVADWSFVPLLLLVTMIFFFMIGFGALSWTVMAEIMPAKVSQIISFFPGTVRNEKINV